MSCRVFGRKAQELSRVPELPPFEEHFGRLEAGLADQRTVGRGPEHAGDRPCLSIDEPQETMIGVRGLESVICLLPKL